MTKEMKINRMKEVIHQLKSQHQKVTKVKVAELTGYHRNFITDNWNACFNQNESVQTENVQIKKSVQKNVSPALKNVQKNNPDIKSVQSTERFKPLKPSPNYSNTYNRFLLRCIKDSNIKSTYLTPDEIAHCIQEIS